LIGIDGFLENSHESPGIGQEDVQELQDHPAQRRGSRDLHGRTSQAAPRLRTRLIAAFNTVLIKRYDQWHV
jgi:hypothetical protein